MARVRAGSEPGGMNRTEREYAGVLDLRVAAGEVARWRFEPLKFRLGAACFYTPDFEVVLADGTLEYHEVKGGHWMEDARVKIKAVAALFADRRFVAVQKRRKKDGGGWKVEEIKPGPGR
jgi:hypothetical protein